MLIFKICISVSLLNCISWSIFAIPQRRFFTTGTNRSIIDQGKLMKTAKHLGYSYSRCSTGRQTKGNSFLRQAAEDKPAKWCKDHGYTLDTTLDLTEAISAFHGKNVTEGKLGAFLQAVDDGLVSPGSALIVESLDRLSREELPIALRLFLDILHRGIDIVTLIPDPIHFAHKTLDTTQLVIAIVMLSTAGEESRKKSVRSLDNWKRMDERVRKGLPNKRLCPTWLTAGEDDKEHSFVPAKLAIIHRMISMSLAGDGTYTIAEKFNAEGVPPLRHGKRWSSGQVKHVLRNRALIGERVIRKHEVVKNYFPSVLSEHDFEKLQQGFAKRSTRKTGRRGIKLTNLFTTLIISSTKQKPLEWIEWSICSTAHHATIAGPRKTPIKRGKKIIRKYHLPYAAVEKALLANLAELNVRDLVAEGNVTHSRLIAAESRLEAVTENLAKCKVGLLANYSDTLAKVVINLEVEAKLLESQISDLQTDLHHSSAATIADLQDLIRRLESEEGEGLLRLRNKLKARISQIVKNIVISDIEERSEQDRTVTFIVNFHHFQRLRYIEVDIKRSPNNKGHIVNTKTAYYDVIPGEWTVGLGVA